MPGRRSIVSVSRCAPSSRERRRDRLLEKQPDVSPVAGAGPLQGRRQVQPTTCFQYGLAHPPATALVEVGRQEEAGFIP